MSKTIAKLAALATLVALALPVSALADSGTPPTQPQRTGNRLARVQQRIDRIEARLANAQQLLEKRTEAVAERCNGQQPDPAADGSNDGGTQTAAPMRRLRCARVQARIERIKDRLDRLQARLEKLKDRLQSHASGNGQASTGLSDADQQTLDGLQQQLESDAA